MSFSDDWLKNGLPNFSGGKDRTLARKMIDNLGGPTGFKTSMRTNADGSVTTVQLKGDMPPQITTTRVETECVKGPFSEYDHATAGYEVRSTYADKDIWSVGNIVSIAVKQLRHLILENAERIRLRFSFRAEGEVEPTSLPEAKLLFDEAEVERTYYDPESTVIPRTYHYWLVFRFKTVALPIQRVTCLGGASVSFADPETSGSNPATEGCVRKALDEPNYPARVFVGGWLETLRLRSTSGAVTTNFLPGSGFLQPLEDGAYLACAEVKAIGTRIDGFRLGDVVTLNTGKTRAAREYEYSASHFMLWFKPRGELLPNDEYGNVHGFLWHPETSPDLRGVNACFGAGGRPWIGSFPRANADNSIWAVSIGWTYPFDTATIWLNEMDGTGSTSISKTVTWGSNQSALRARGSGTPAPRVIDVSSHGDKFLVMFPVSTGYPANVNGIAEFVITGDAPMVSVSCNWICDTTTAISGAFYGDDDTLVTLGLKSRTIGTWSRNVPSPTSWPPSGNAFEEYTVEAYMGVSVNGAAPSYVFASSHHHRLDGVADPEETLRWVTTTVDTYTTLAGVSSATTNDPDNRLSPGVGSGGPTVTDTTSIYRLQYICPKVFYAYTGTMQYCIPVVKGVIGVAVTGLVDTTFILGSLNPVTGEFKTFEVALPFDNHTVFPIYGNFI